MIEYSQMTQRLSQKASVIDDFIFNEKISQTSRLSHKLSDIVVDFGKTKARSAIRKINSGYLFKDAHKINGETYLLTLPSQYKKSQFVVKQQRPTHSKNSGRNMALQKCKSDSRLQINKNIAITVGEDAQKFVSKQIKYSQNAHQDITFDDSQLEQIPYSSLPMNKIISEDQSIANILDQIREM